LKYLSVCSGIEAATVAWHSLGWKAVAYSEIEKFPSEVLAHHYPNTPNVGDMTKFKEWNFESNVDVLVGGTPCQSFSVAGLRKGLDDPRGNLMLTYLAIARQYSPRWLVWENVPACYPVTEDSTLPHYFEGWGNSGMGLPTEFLTLNTLEWHSAAAVCSLSDTLETGELPQRFFLSATACKGILRRAEKRGKTLPSALHEALASVTTLNPKT
jgi:hypothetical protein